MTHHTRWRPAAAAPALALALALGAAGCGSGASSTAESGGGAQVAITAQGTAYQPTSLAAPASSQVTITFTNRDAFAHSITFDDGSQSVDASGGGSSTLTFTSGAAGTRIAFHCRYHPTQMHGTISVGGSGGPAAPASSSPSSSGGYRY